MVRTDDFGQRRPKLKDRVGRLRIFERLDRLTAGNPGDAKPVAIGPMVAVGAASPMPRCRVPPSAGAGSVVAGVVLEFDVAEVFEQRR